METNENILETLVEKAAAYSNTNFELYTLKAVDKTADLASTLISHTLLTIVISIFAFCINIAAALWLGDILGKTYYGFLVVASCYAMAGIVMLAIRPIIKSGINNRIIRQLLN